MFTIRRNPALWIRVPSWAMFSARYVAGMADYLHPLAAPFTFEGTRDDGVLLLHGWTGSPAHFRPLGTFLDDAGYTVSAPLLAGHGTAIEDIVATGWRDWMESAVAAALDLTATGKRLHLVGLSMGGVIALLLAPVLDAASIVTINAPQLVWDRRSRLGGLFRGSKRIKPGDSLVPAPDEMREFQQQYEGTPIGTIAELNDLIRAANRNLERVLCPALVIQSRADETVKPKSGDIIFDGLGSHQKGMVWLETSRHVALLDDERDVIAAEVLEHLETNSMAAHSK
jgi:carboxylesterase